MNKEIKKQTCAKWLHQVGYRDALRENSTCPFYDFSQTNSDVHFL